MSLDDQPQNPLQLFLTSIKEWTFSEVSLQASNIHTLPTDNSNIRKQNQQCHTSF